MIQALDGSKKLERLNANSIQRIIRHQKRVYKLQRFLVGLCFSVSHPATLLGSICFPVLNRARGRADLLR
jgi:hypothetical protein